MTLPPHPAASRHGDARLAAALVVPALCLYSLFVLWPILQVFWLALHRWDGYGPQHWIGAANFGLLWSDPQFRTALRHSLEWEAGAVIAPLVLGLGLALLARAGRARHVSLSLLFFPALLPPAGVAALWVLFLSPVSGPLNTFLISIGLGALAFNWLGDPHSALGCLFAVWLWASVGVSVILYSVGLSAVGPEYQETARAEGAGALWRFCHITVPGLRHTTAVLVVLNAALGAQVFDLIFMTTGGGPGYATMTVALDMYGRAFDGRTGEGAAAAAIQLLLGGLLAAAAFLFVRPSSHSFQSGEAHPWPSRRARGGWTATAIMGMILVALLVPLAWLCAAALEPGRSLVLGSSHFVLDPRGWTADNVSSVWRSGMGTAIVRSASVALGVVLLTLLLAVPAAYSLARLIHIRGLRTGLFLLLIIGLLQPTSVLIIPLFSLLRSLQLLGTEWGAILPEVARSLPFAVLFLWGWFRESPPDILEAACVDGASSITQLTAMALPLARPAIVAAAVWIFITSWNEYLLPTLVSQDGSLQTVPTLLATYIGSYNTQFGLLAAGTLLAMLPSAALYLVLRRQAVASSSPAEHVIR